MLTDYGMETMRKVAPHHVASVRRHFVDLVSAEELGSMRQALSAIAEHLRSQRGKP